MLFQPVAGVNLTIWDHPSVFRDVHHPVDGKITACKYIGQETDKNTAQFFTPTLVRIPIKSWLGKHPVITCYYFFPILPPRPGSN